MSETFNDFVDSEAGQDLIDSYQTVVVELERLLSLDVIRKGDIEATETLIDEVFTELCEIHESGGLDEICDRILHTKQDSLKVFHDFLEKAVWSK